MSDNFKVKKITVPSKLAPLCSSCGNPSDYWVKVGSKETYICKRGLAALMNEIVNCCLIDDMEDEDED